MTPSSATTLATGHSHDDDQQLARRIAAGDRHAFELLIRRNNRRLYRLARAALRDDAEAEDALQEAYLSAYRAIGEFRGEAALTTWLSRLVVNQCLGRLRRHTRREKVIPMVAASGDDAMEYDFPAPDDDAPERAFARAELRGLIERELDRLPKTFRLVFVMREVEEMSVEETAQSLDIPEATVRSRHFRARSMLREALAREIDLAGRDVYEFGGLRCDRVVRGVMTRLERNHGGTA